MANEWGPLAGLVGQWEGEVGLDTAFSHSLGKVHETPYRETCVFNGFGPVENGRQSLYGVDYRTSMFREGQEGAFHTELGYWTWDAATGELTRAFVIPRGIAIVAGGIAAADATTFTLTASMGSPTYAIGQNEYLHAHACNLSYEVTITVGDGEWSYRQTTMLGMDEMSEPLAHTDHNTLRRVG